MSYLARETRAARPDLAHSFGLFCDIGIPLLKAKVPTYLETLSLANRAAARRFIEVEHARHGINHALVGALLAEKWAISSDIVQAIRKHHDSDVLFDESVPVTVRNLVALNHVVEKAIQTHRGEAESLEWLEDGSAAIEALGWSQSDVDNTCEALVDRFKSPNSALRASSM